MSDTRREEQVATGETWHVTTTDSTTVYVWTDFRDETAEQRAKDFAADIGFIADYHKAGTADCELHRDTREVATEGRGWDEWAHVRCDVCGRFCTPVDSAGAWGSYGMDEPPEPVFYCPSCADTLFRRMLANLIERGIPIHKHRPYYESPTAWYRARAIVRGKRKHGLLRFVVRHELVREERHSPSRVEYCERCDKPKGHPIHDREKARRMGAVAHVWERKHGGLVSRGTGQRSKIRRWCSCGWATPLLYGNGKYLSTETGIFPQWDEFGGIDGDWWSRELLNKHVNGARHD